jgi:hypothetical protein
VGLFLPSYDGTKLSFVRELLQNKKKALLRADVKMLTVPRYEELSVKNLYDDAMKDEELRLYLPEHDHLSSKLPERDFFFGVLGTVRPEYLKSIINHAEEQRTKPD